jgi:hypothetical protein
MLKAIFGTLALAFALTAGEANTAACCNKCQHTEAGCACNCESKCACCGQEQCKCASGDCTSASCKRHK